MHKVTSKLGRLVVGIIAAGGVAVALAGSASAADVPASGVVHDSSQSSTTVTSNTKTQVNVVTSDNNATTSGGAQSDITPGGKSTGTSVALTAGPDSNQPTPTPVSDGVSPDKTVTGAAAANQPVSTLPAPISSANPQPITQTIILHARLAASAVSMPSSAVQLAPLEAPANNHPALPQAPQGDGLFGAITTFLAGVTVPASWSAGGSAGAALLVPFAIILCPLIVLVSLIALTYGLSLRRSGFVTAARSDVSVFTFATPHLMNYVPSMVT